MTPTSMHREWIIGLLLPLQVALKSGDQIFGITFILKYLNASFFPILEMIKLDKSITTLHGCNFVMKVAGDL